MYIAKNWSKQGTAIRST